MKNFDRSTMSERFAEQPVIHLTSQNPEAVFHEVSQWFPEAVSLTSDVFSASARQYANEGRSNGLKRPYVYDADYMLILTLTEEDLADRRNVEFEAFMTLVLRKIQKLPTVVITRNPFAADIFEKQICSPVSVD